MNKDALRAEQNTSAFDIQKSLDFEVKSISFINEESDLNLPLAYRLSFVYISALILGQKTITQDTNTPTRLDQLLNYFKNHKVASIMCFAFILYVGFASLISATEQNIKPIKWALSKISFDKEKHTVKLVIPSSMYDAKVEIDNEEASVLERTPNFIIITVDKSPLTRVFTIKGSGERICAVSQEIQVDNYEIIFNC